MCAEVESEVREASDSGTCPSNSKAFSFAGFVCVTDALDIGEVGALNIRHRVTDKCAFAWLGVKGIYCSCDQVRAWLEESRVVVGPRDDKTDPVV